MSLKNDKVKRKAVALREEGIGITEISRILGIPHQTVSDFLNKRSYREWWTDNNETGPDGPDILFIDIETSPMLLAGFGLFNQNFSLKQIITDWEIMMVGFKWYGEGRTTVITSEDYWKRGDRDCLEDLVLSVWALLDNADIIIGHNGRRFDNKKIKAKFAQYKLPPPSPYRVIDTLEIAKKQFGFTSNKLDYLSQVTGGDGKMDTGGIELWLDCMKGDDDAWRKMEDYCATDVDELERVWLAFRGWDNKSPNMQLYYSDGLDRCGNCGSVDVEDVVGKQAYTNLSSYNLVRCNSCGSYRRRRENTRTKEVMKNTTMNVG